MKFILIINKPPNLTSHDIVDRIRKITGIRKVGHAGTLDPFATGVLIILIDEATKSQDAIMHQEKEYIGTIKLGETSETFDKTGVITKASDRQPAKKEVVLVLEEFIGEISQVPPRYSAIKVKGRKMYELARKGIEFQPEPRKVFIKSIEILDYQYPYLKIKTVCGSGTYIRSLANDIGANLSAGGYLQELERTRIGNYKLEDAVKLEELTKENWKQYGIEIS